MKYQLTRIPQPAGQMVAARLDWMPEVRRTQLFCSIIVTSVASTD